MNEVAVKGSPGYDLFISYYAKTGKDFAHCLKTGLRDFNLTAFRDEEDIPQSVQEDTDEWRNHIDNAIKQSQNFILIMTVGFNKRREIARELKIAFENNQKKYFFKHNDLNTTDLIIEVDNKPVDLSKYEFISFENEVDLLRKVVSALLGKIGQLKEPVFMNEAGRMIATEGLEFRKESFPLIELVIGPTNETTEWLQANSQNKFLVSCFPYYDQIEVRRKFFETKADKNVFFKVQTNGFFHVALKLLSSESRTDLLLFDSIFLQVIQPLLFSIRLMKFYNINNPHSILILLKNVGGMKVTFNLWDGNLWEYSFTNSLPEIDFHYSFNPVDDWKEIAEICLKIYRDICTEAGCLGILDSTIKQRVRECIFGMRELRTSYNGENIVLPLIDRSSFGLG